MDHEGVLGQRSRGAAAGVIDGLIYLVGGFGPSVSSSVVEVYNPATDSWSTLASMLTARDEAAIGVLDGRLFIAGGKTGPDPSTLVSTLEGFRPPETTWWTSDSGVATINPTGTATAVASGTATITARSVGVDCSTSSGCGTLTVTGGAPGAPGAPTVTGSGNTITFNWTPASGSPTVYTLIARVTQGGPIVASIPVGNVTSFSVTAPNGTFVISVQASNAQGTGPESPGTTVSVPDRRDIARRAAEFGGVVQRGHRDVDLGAADERWRADRLSRSGVTHSGRDVIRVGHTGQRDQSRRSRAFRQACSTCASWPSMLAGQGAGVERSRAEFGGLHAAHGANGSDGRLCERRSRR